MFVYEVICLTARSLTLVLLWIWLTWPAAGSDFASTNSIVQYSSRVWQTDEGLPQNSVQALAQTRDGYLWVGTLRGLARFDGMHFTVFNPQNTPALQQPCISALCEARDHSLWIGTAGGGLTQMRQNQFTHHALGPDLRANTIKCILETSDGTLWVGTLGGLFRYRDGKWSCYMVKDGLQDNAVRSLCEVGDQLRIGTGSGLNFLQNGVITSHLIRCGVESVSVRALLRDKGDFWLGLTEGLARTDSTNRMQESRAVLQTKKDGLPDNNVTALYKDSRGNLWVGTYGGLCRLVEGKCIVEKDNEGAFYDQVNAIMEDEEGDIWVGARDGLHKLRAKQFVSYTRQQGLTHNNITSVLEDRGGNLWISTWGGGVMRLKNDKITAYNKENIDQYGLGTDLVLSLFEDKDGSILLGGDYETGTFRFSNGKFNRIWNREEARTYRSIRVIYRDREGNLWFGASPGLVQGRLRYLEHTDIRCILEDPEGNLWVGTNDGLYRRKNGKLERFALPDDATNRTVLALYEDKEQNLWISVEGYGLCCYRNGSVTVYNVRQGLWSDEIYEILEDDHGWFWMSCPKGIFRVNKSNLAALENGKASTITSIAYGRADGLESLQCSGVAKPAAWRSRDGRLWFATTKGLVVTNPNADLGVNDRPPPVKIEEVLADNHPVALDGSGVVQVGPGRGELEFHYTALSFQMPEKNCFRYRLSSVDPDWVDAGSRRVAYYNNLKPGHYQFEVMAANNNGIWNEHSAKLGMALSPHCYQTWWFSSMAVLGIAGLIGGTVRISTQRKLQWELARLEHQNAIEKERARIAQDMHDDLGARLTEILLLNELARKNQTVSERLETYLVKQSQVVRDVAGSLSTIVWAVNPVNDTLDRLANYLYEQVERLLAMSSIRCRFDVPNELPNSFVSSEVRHNVFLAVRESINNAIKHSGATELWFRLRTSPGTVSIVIEDNGRGITSADRSACGNGLQNMERRMKNLGGSFRLSSQPGKGTQIRLEVPLKPDADA